MSDSHSAPLNALNYLNVVAYIGNVVVTYGLGVLGWLGAKTNSELSEKYQTPVTPAGWAFSIWATIFISQFIFTFAQLLPTFRSSPLVQQGVSFFYIGACFSQIAWTIVFSTEHITLSLGPMLAILVFLLRITVSQNKVNNDNDGGTRREFWLLDFPFALHCGWIIAASFVNLNLVFIDTLASIQLCVAIVSLVGVFLAASTALLLPMRPRFVIPIVLIWATAGICGELGTPTDLISNTFTSATVLWIRIGAGSVSGLIALLVVVVAFKKAGGSDNVESNFLKTNNQGTANF